MTADTKSKPLEDALVLFFVLLGFDILMNVAAVINALVTIVNLQDLRSGERSVDQSLLNGLENSQRIFGGIILTGLGVGVGLMRWLNSCYRFANISLGASGLKNAGWTVTAWILPIVNLFKPYQIVKESLNK